MTNAGNITGWRGLGTINMAARYRFDGVAFGSFLYLGGGTTTLQVDNQNTTQEAEVTNTIEYSVIGKTRR
ncbi:MAG: hypothetical protein ABEN55_23265 [Bradymonadaceae bacterium]